MDIEKIIQEIEQLEQLYLLPDSRPVSASDRVAANRKHDESNANNPWFRLWKTYGI